MDDQLVHSFSRQKRLPGELIYIILSYMRLSQDPILLTDITNYCRTWSAISNEYYRKCVIYYGKITVKNKVIGKNKIWLDTDLILYANNNIPIFRQMQPELKEILNRAFNVKREIRLHLFNTSRCSLPSRPAILWGLLTPLERDAFIIQMVKINCYQ